MPAINAADTAWLLAATTLVMLMVPGLAIFYGGMVRARSVLNTMMMTFVTLGIVTLVWVCWGYSLAFGKDHGHGLIGDFSHVGLKNTMDQVYGTVPTPVLAKGLPGARWPPELIVRGSSLLATPVPPKVPPLLMVTGPVPSGCPLALLVVKSVPSFTTVPPV